MSSQGRETVVISDTPGSQHDNETTPNNDDDIIMGERPTTTTLGDEITPEASNNVYGQIDEDQVQTDDSIISESVKQKYRIWKKNSPYLYDYLQTSALIWPSLTVQWFPDVEHDAKHNTFTYRLLTGTFTSGSADEQLKISTFTTKPLRNLALVDKYDLESREFLANDSDKAHFQKISQLQTILHHGEINKARYMPQKPDVIASINNLGQTYIFDRTKHSSALLRTKALINDGFNFKPQIKLAHHSKEGFGLAWNLQKEGLLLSAALDGDAVLWDIKNYESNSNGSDGDDSGASELKPELVFKSIHSGGVNDIQWLPQHDSIFGTVGEDKKFCLFDIRKANKNKNESNVHGDDIDHGTQCLVLMNSTAHGASINALSFNHGNMFCAATADSQGTIAIWDLRSLGKGPIHTILNAHQGSIAALEWNPSGGKSDDGNDGNDNNSHRVLASGGQDDHLVKLWDMSQIVPSDEGTSRTDLVKTPNPPELLFVHGGHMLGINDLSWNMNPSDDWMIGSVANDNSLHVWKPADTIIGRSLE